ncbi:MAG: hypothetical protein JXB03_11460 [Spirochaetales bacterium]|nr:hypothetical protein [Spirochaetales bacterium]
MKLITRISIAVSSLLLLFISSCSFDGYTKSEIDQKIAELEDAQQAADEAALEAALANDALAAYGTINADTQTIISGSGNFSISRTMPGFINIDFDDFSFNYLEYTVSIILYNTTGYAYYSYGGGDLIVQLRNDDGNQFNPTFSFLVFENLM